MNGVDEVNFGVVWCEMMSFSRVQVSAIICHRVCSSNVARHHVEHWRIGCLDFRKREGVEVLRKMLG